MRPLYASIHEREIHFLRCDIDELQRKLTTAQAVIEAARQVHDTFVKSEAAGYRSRDRQFAIEVLGKFLAAHGILRDGATRSESAPSREGE